MGQIETLCEECCSEQEQIIYTDQVIIGNQLLFEVPFAQMSKPIHKNIVALEWKKQNSVGRGSGLLISKNLVLTSAHNFYHKGVKISKHLFSIFLRQGGISKTYKIQKRFIPIQYENCPNSLKVKYDYALIKLTQRVIQAADFLELNGSFVFDKSRSYVITILGYPEKSYKKMDLKEEIYSITQWGASKNNAILTINENKGEITHLVSTEGGQSGSPILIEQGEKLSVIGIHKGGAIRKMASLQKETANVGRWLNKQLIEILKREAQKMKADMFKVKDYQKGNNASELLSKGNEHYRDKQYQKAIDCYRKAIEIDPKLSMAYYNLGVALYDVKKFKEAIDCYQKAIEIDPQYSYDYNNLGNALKALNKVEEAIECYRKAIKINPQNSQAYNNLGTALSDVNKVEEAIDCYGKAIKIDPKNSQPYNNLGTLLLNVNKAQQAIICYRKAIKINPEDQNSFFNLGLALYANKKVQEAIKCYQKIIQINPKYSQAYNGLGVIYSQEMKDMQSAISYYHQALELDPQNQIIKKNFKYALQYFRKAGIIPKGFEGYFSKANKK